MNKENLGLTELYFEDLEFLEPKCPKCSTKIVYDTNTKFDEKVNAHVCNKCGTIIK